MSRHPNARPSKMNQDEKSIQYEAIASSRTYQAIQTITTWMDTYYIDPILGFFFPGFGDMVTALFALPCFYISILKLRSFPLTLALAYNILFDVFVGMIPAYIGDLFDTFNRAHVKNLRLIKGYVEQDKSIISEVNRKAIYFAILIFIMLSLITLLVLFLVQIVAWMSEAWNWIVGVL